MIATEPEMRAPHVGQKRRVTGSSLPPKRMYSTSKPVMLTVSLGTAKTALCPEPLNLRQVLQ
jgi:hypothetical protein